MSPGLTFVVLSALFLIVGALERVPAFQFRPSAILRPYMTTDGAWYLVATTAGLVSTFVFRPQLSKLAIPAVATSVANLPWFPRLLLAVVLYDLVAFLVHVGIHQSSALWSVHKVHHSSLHLDGLATTRTHMFELLIRNVPAQAVLFAIGMPAAVVSTALLIYATFALHGHSNLRVGGRWLELLIVTPRLHRLHHLPATTQHNFGTVFTIWDRLLGRLVARDTSPDERTGVPGEIDDYPQRFLPAFRQPAKEARARHAHPDRPLEPSPTSPIPAPSVLLRDGPSGWTSTGPTRAAQD